MASIPTLKPQTAVLVAGGSWAFNFACQMYGMLSTPNMKDIADKYHAFGSPAAFMIALFFFPQTLLQLYWIYGIYKRHGLKSGGGALQLDDSATGGGGASDDEAVKYAPVFALGNLSIGLWMLAWNNEHLAIALIFVLINSSSQLYYVFARLPPLDRDTLLTHIVAKMFAGIGILDIVDNASSAFVPYATTGFVPGYGVYAVSVLVSAALAAACDGMMGLIVAYCVFALFLGQMGQAAWALVILINLAIVLAGSAAKYYRERETYASLLQNEQDVV